MEGCIISISAGDSVERRGNVESFHLRPVLRPDSYVDFLFGHASPKRIAPLMAERRIRPMNYDHGDRCDIFLDISSREADLQVGKSASIIGQRLLYTNVEWFIPKIALHSD